MSDSALTGSANEVGHRRVKASPADGLDMHDLIARSLAGSRILSDLVELAWNFEFVYPQQVLRLVTTVSYSSVIDRAMVEFLTSIDLSRNYCIPSGLHRQSEDCGSRLNLTVC